MTTASTATELTSQTRDEIIREAKRIEEDTLYSSKGHFTAAQLWSIFHFVVGLPAAVIAALTAASAFGKFDPSGTLTGLLAILVTSLTAVLAFVNPNERSSSHLKAGNEYDSLMNRARIFWSIDCRSSDVDEALTTRVKGLSEEKDRLNRNSVQLSWIAYKLAKRGVLAGEGAHTVDKQ